jgi:hypothetical protein
MKTIRLPALALIAIAMSIIAGLLLPKSVQKPELTDDFYNVTSTPTTVPPTPSPPALPRQKILENEYHIFQTFNNCGPASLSMALSYYGIEVSQEVLGSQLRPYQIANGNNDDKSVTLEELSGKSAEFGLVPFHRPGGTVELIKNFIASGIPVITRTLTKTDEDIGHFRVVKGYDDATAEFIQDDSLQGHNLRFSYQTFIDLWKPYNFEFLILVTHKNEGLARQILRDLVDNDKSWRNALYLAQTQLDKNPNDVYAQLNLSIAYYKINEFEKSVEAFEKVESELPFRTLWYQIEPILAYYKKGDYQKVFEATDIILSNGNRAYSEAYMIRGAIYEESGNLVKAREEYQKAILYNKNLLQAQEAFERVS